jgi:glycosyltransferase involved in cell wall biosynthesis
MNTPIIIAARNEAEHIRRTLDVLSKQAHEIEPVVIVNGSTDRSADIARATGATVLESPEGKMPAIQEGLRHLGKRALEPVLILDADSRPFSKNWSGRMSSELLDLADQKPAMVWGPYVFNGEINPALGAFFTATSMRVSWADRHEDRPRTIRGGNTGLYMKEDELLEEMLALDNYWPREDVAIFDTMKSHEANHKVVMPPQAWVLTSGFRTMDTIRKIVKDRKHPSKVMDDSYTSDAPTGSKPYFSETTATVVHEEKNFD